MSEQREMTDIRMGLDKILCEFHDPDIPYEEQSSPLLDWSWYFTQKILTYLHENGVVRKVEGELPLPRRPIAMDPHPDYYVAQQDMIDAGYTLTAPLLQTESSSEVVCPICVKACGPQTTEQFLVKHLTEVILLLRQLEVSVRSSTYPSDQ